MGFQNQSLKFHSDALGEEALFVKSVDGHEQVSGLFRFELELISNDPKIDLEKVLYAPAKLGLLQHLGGDLKTFKYWAGCLEEFQQLEKGQEWVSYRAVLVPDLAKLDEFYRSRIFMKQTVRAMVTAILDKDAKLGEGVDFEWKLAGSDPEREYAVQYEETDLAFVSRWLEHAGIYYFFDNDGTSEMLRFSDQTGGYKPVNPAGSKYPYRPEGHAQSGSSTQSKEGEEQLEEIQAIRCTANRQPASVALNDYNWRDPSTRLASTKPVCDKGVGLQNEYNDHYKTKDEGSALATIRAEEWKCRALVYSGVSTCRGFRPGKTFDLTEHYRADFNASYLVTSVHHKAEQAINLETGTVSGAHYENEFSAIPADKVFRPERVTEWPAIRGVMHARVDSAGDGAKADVDDMGRYRIKIPFDEAMDDTPDGEASRYVRMAQPYAGVDSGMHFPLLKGTEVLLAHIDGDPDRPIIASAVPNPETASPVDSSNASQNRIQTTSGNMMLMDDDADATGFLMVSGNGNFVQDFRLAGGKTGAGTGVGGGRVPGGRSRTPVSRPGESSKPRDLLYANLPPQLRRKVFGPGMGGQVGGRRTSLEQTNADPTASSTIDQGMGLIGGRGGSMEGDYFLDSQVYPKKIEIRVGDMVKVTQCSNFFHFADVEKESTFGTGGESYHEENGNVTSTTKHTGDLTSTNTQMGNIKSDDQRLGTVDSFEMTADAVISKSITVGGIDGFALRSASDQLLSITLGQKGEIEMDLGANKMKVEITAGMRSTMKLNAAVETEFLAGGPTTNVRITPKTDDIELTWRTWLGMKEDQVALQKTDTALSKTDTQVQQADTTVQKTDTAVQATETQVQQTSTQVQQTATKVQSTQTSVQSTETQVQQTQTNAQQTGTTMMNTETQAMRTSTSGATMIN